MIRTISGASVVGIARSSFQSNGETVYGYTVSFTYPLTSEGSSGSGVGQLWLSKKAFDDAYIDLGTSLSVARVRVGDRSKFELIS